MLALYHNLSPVAIFSSLCYKNCLRSLSYFLSQTFNRRPGSKQQQGEEGQEEKELQIGNFKRRFPNILPMSIRIDQYSIVKLLLTCYLLLSKWVGSNILLFLRIKCNQISLIDNLHLCKRSFVGLNTSCLSLKPCLRWPRDKLRPPLSQELKIKWSIKEVNDIDLKLLNMERKSFLSKSILSDYFGAG